MLNRLVITVALLICVGCTEQQMAREFGGNTSLILPPSQKLINVTWREGNALWYLTRPMRDDDTPETYKFSESSSFGVWEGTVTIKETR